MCTFNIYKSIFAANPPFNIRVVPAPRSSNSFNQRRAEEERNIAALSLFGAQPLKKSTPSLAALHLANLHTSSWRPGLRGGAPKKEPPPRYVRPWFQGGLAVSNIIIKQEQPPNPPAFLPEPPASCCLR